MPVYSNDAKKAPNQRSIETFMSKMRSDSQHVPPFPMMPSLAVRRLRARLMLEEAIETIEKGLGLQIVLQAHEFPKDDDYDIGALADRFAYREAGPGDLVQVADGIADCEVVNSGTASACGIAQQPCFDLVMGNNHLKFAPGHVFRSDGKLVKPPNHPDIATELYAELIQQGMSSKEPALG